VITSLLPLPCQLLRAPGAVGMAGISSTLFQPLQSGH